MGKKRSGAARCLDHRFYMVEVPVECAASRGGQPVERLRAPLLEAFRTAYVSCFLKLARVGAQISIADVELCFELTESELVADRERAHDAEPNPLVNQSG